MDWLPEQHLARVIDTLVEETLDVTSLLSSFVEERGYPPHDPQLMLDLLLYGYATGGVFVTEAGTSGRCTPARMPTVRPHNPVGLHTRPG